MAPESVKPHPDNVWWLKRLGLSLAGLVAAGVIAGVANAIGIDVVRLIGDIFFLLALVACFVANSRWTAEDLRRERRRRAALSTLRGERVATAPAPERSARARRRGFAAWTCTGVLMCGIPLTLIGALVHSTPVRNIGVVLIAIELVVLGVALPGLAWRTRRHSRSQ